MRSSASARWMRRIRRGSGRPYRLFPGLLRARSVSDRVGATEPRELLPRAPKVYTFGPTFRAENSNTSRHLAEFWMIEPEIAFADLDANAALAEDYLKTVIADVLAERADDMRFFAERIDKTTIARLEHVVRTPFTRLDYGEAVKILETAPVKFEFPIGWGADLQSEHERYLTEQHVEGPIVVTNYPKDIKAFYMRQNDDGKTVAAMDVLSARRRRDHRWQPTRRAARQARHPHGRDEHPDPRPRVVSRAPPLRHRAARRLRPRPRAPRALRDRHGQHPRRDPFPRVPNNASF